MEVVIPREVENSPGRLGHAVVIASGEFQRAVCCRRRAQEAVQESLQEVGCLHCCYCHVVPRVPRNRRQGQKERVRKVQAENLLHQVQMECCDPSSPSCLFDCCVGRRLLSVCSHLMVVSVVVPMQVVVQDVVQEIEMARKLLKE